MTIASDFVPFCNSNSNLTALGSYDGLAPAGQGPGGIANSALNNRALRQGTTIAAVVAEFMLNITQTNIQDNYNTSDTTISATLYAQFVASVADLPPVVSNLLSGTSATYAPPIYFFCSVFTTPPAAGATYTNNGVTFTVLSSTTIAGVSVSLMNATSAIGAPLASGTLTKASGTGDATVTFYAFRAPLSLDVDVKGGGGAGGGGNAINNTSFGAGGGEGGRLITNLLNPSLSGITYTVGASATGTYNTTVAGNSSIFGSLTAGGGSGGVQATGITTSEVFTNINPGAGGSASSTASVVGLPGMPGSPGIQCTTTSIVSGNGGGVGGGKGLGALNYSTGVSSAGNAGAANSGGGGGGAYAWGATAQVNGGNGASGYIFLKANFQ